MRLLALDEREPFTLYRLSPGDQAGHIGILRGVTGYALAASQPSLLWLLPQSLFWLSQKTENFKMNLKIPA